MKPMHSIVRTVDLGYDQLLMLDGEPGTRVKVLFGGVWLTEEGATQDVFAADGEEVALRTRKGALLEALGPTRVQVIEPRRGPRRWLRTAAHALRERFAAVLPALFAARAFGRRSLPQALPAKLVALAIAIGIGMGVPELIAKQFALEQAASQATVLAKASRDAAQCEVGAGVAQTLDAVASARAVFLPIN